MGLDAFQVVHGVPLVEAKTLVIENRASLVPVVVVVFYRITPFGFDGDCPG